MSGTPRHKDAGEPEETESLLRPSSNGSQTIHDLRDGCGAATSGEQPLEKFQPSTSDSGGTSKECAICRICLEEDAVPNLEAPCACSGTQRYAHHACIQRWVEEKGNTRCEICEQQYTGQYTVPPPPPAPIPLDDLPMMGPLFILDPADHASRQHIGYGGRHPLIAGSPWGEVVGDYGYHQRHTGMNWCVSFIVLFMFLLVMHHTMVITDGTGTGTDYDGGSSGAGTSGGAGAGGSAPSGGSSSGTGGVDGADDYAASLGVFLFWVLTKLLLIGLPVYMVMRIAARQAQREQYTTTFVHMPGTGQQAQGHLHDYEVDPAVRFLQRLRALAAVQQQRVQRQLQELQDEEMGMGQGPAAQAAALPAAAAGPVAAGAGVAATAAPGSGHVQVEVLPEARVAAPQQQPAAAQPVHSAV